MQSMKRRSFFGLLSSGVMAVAVAGFKLGGSFGLMTPDRWHVLGLRGTHRVRLNGVDITHGCSRFNDREGWAEVHKRNSAGNFYVEYVRPDGSIFIPGPDDYHTEESLKWEARVAKETLRGRISVQKIHEHA